MCGGVLGFIRVVGNDEAYNNSGLITFNLTPAAPQEPGKEPPRYNFWGYSTVGFHAPMDRYAAAGDPGTQLKCAGLCVNWVCKGGNGAYIVGPDSLWHVYEPSHALWSVPGRYSAQFLHAPFPGSWSRPVTGVASR